LNVRVIKIPHKTFHFELNHKSRLATSAKNLVQIPFEQKHREQDFLIKKNEIKIVFGIKTILVLLIVKFIGENIVTNIV
jgi:hypothetical protein